MGRGAKLTSSSYSTYALEGDTGDRPLFAPRAGAGKVCPTNSNVKGHSGDIHVFASARTFSMS
jgi:hypothetical protein